MGRFLVFFAILLDLIAAGCTYVYGAVLVPNVLHLASWLADSFGRFLFYLLSWGWLPHLPVLPFPIDLKQIAATRNRVWGLLWLGLYGLTRLHFFRNNSMMQKRAPANTLYPNEVRWRLVEQCLQQYRQALMRFLTPPIRLKVPTTFRYEVQEASTAITWQRRAPVLPTFLLQESAQPALAALLAVELAKYHCADRFVHAWMATYPLRQPGFMITWMGIFFWLPASLVRAKCYKDWCKGRELLYDEFAYLCGQGEALLSILRFNEAHDIQMFATEYEPGTLERIGHLEALLLKEYEQMDQLGLQVPELPGPLAPSAKRRTRSVIQESQPQMLLPGGETGR